MDNLVIVHLGIRRDNESLSKSNNIVAITKFKDNYVFSGEQNVLLSHRGRPKQFSSLDKMIFELGNIIKDYKGNEVKFNFKDVTGDPTNPSEFTNYTNEFV